ncbi:MAG: glutamate dehydrogenase [Desulfuromonadales bacterium]|jgi:glutamate dehydrogenase (NAD(P)+)|nr:glutamate dehydrogenase [Desulfuromonadales bacterium]
MLDVFSIADELGPAKIIHIHEPTIGLKAVLVVDNVSTGPAIGGLRMAPDVSTEECFRLARAMTLKNAVAGLAHGGGKSVLFGDPKMPVEKKERLIRAMACALRNCHDYIFGPDMGTDETCMAWVKDEIDRAVGLPEAIGGIPLDKIGATGWGVRHAVEVAAPVAGFPLAGARIVVQGFGAVGQHAARFLGEQGTILVGAADSKGTLYDPEGIDVGKLMELKNAGKSVLDYAGGQKLDRDAVIGLECEVWIPAARPDVITEANVDRLRTRLVAQGANIPMTPAAEKTLHERGVLCLPDFIANAGGVICGAMEYHGGWKGLVFDVVEDKIRANTEEMLRRVKREDRLPRDIAIDMALAALRKAMATRRWTIY